MRLQKLLPALCLLLASFQPLNAQYSPVFESVRSRQWADSMLTTLSYRQKLGQLFMADAFSNKDSLHVQNIRTLIDSFQIGGLIFFQGGPVRQAILTNDYQRRSKVPLMIGIDGEWGLSMRLDSTFRYPRQMTMSAAGVPRHVYEMGAAVAAGCKRMGIHINFAPAVDINNNPLNPIINSRSFGEDKDQVALFGKMYMKGMQENGILACGKHFPGHGNTDTDSHLSLPAVHSSRAELDSMELYPFRTLIKDSVSSMMVAHLFVPALDSTAGRASSLSPAVVDTLLQQQLGFRGLIFTDALNMKGVASYFQPGELEWNAFLAGNDVMLYSENIPKAIERLHLGIQNCEIEQSEVDRRVRKILMAKYWAGLNHPSVIDTANLIADLNKPVDKWLDYQLYEHAVTLLRNKGSIIPLSPYNRECIASVALNDSTGNTFQQYLNCYAKVDRFSLPRDASRKAVDSLMNVLDDYDKVIVSVHNTSTNASKNFNLNENLLGMLGKLAHQKGTILCLFGNAYILGKIEDLEKYHAVVESYEDNWYPQAITAQKLFGVSGFNGQLPVSPDEIYKRGMGIPAPLTPRLKYTLPQEAGLSDRDLLPIDSIINKAIHDSVMPGCQVLVSLHGKVILDKSYGYFTYDSTRAVRNTDVYDLASVTKMASTSLAVMHLVEKHRLNPDEKASRYLPELRKSNKKDLTLRQLMAHQAGLQAWIPFYKNTLDSAGYPDQRLYRKQPEKKFSIRVADSLYLRDDYPDSIWQAIVKSTVDPPGKYVYSDLGMIIMQHVVERVSGKSIDDYVTDNFYKPMGLWKLQFNPLEKLDSSEIVPTEIDTAFRHQLVRGSVHDPAAALLDGVAGHAGLFGNARSLAAVMQMLMYDGEYGGKRYLKSETIDLFTEPAFPGTPNRRGMIFDKPEPDLSVPGPTAKDASHMTFGHTGFTGTCAWADPENGLVYVFLSNRVYPSAGNNKLAKQNIRTSVMQVVYEALKAK